MQDAIGFCKYYMKGLNNVNKYVWDENEDEIIIRDVSK